MLLFIYIGVISENNLNSSIMKKVVLTLVAAVSVLTMNAQRYMYAKGVYIDSTEELGSFDNPYIVDMYLDADPYVWFYQEEWNEGIRTGKGMYGLKEDMIEYAYNLIHEIGGGIYDYDKIETEYRIDWDIITDSGDHYFMVLELFEETAQLYIDELSYDENIDQLKYLKSHYIKLYGKDKVNEWLGK
jgi:hypothetical protein